MSDPCTVPAPVLFGPPRPPRQRTGNPAGERGPSVLPASDEQFMRPGHAAALLSMPIAELRARLTQREVLRAGMWQARLAQTHLVAVKWLGRKHAENPQ